MLIKVREQNSQVAIELTPIIDMVFLLLVFFLVATTFAQEERETQIALPVSKSSGPISAMLRALVVNIDTEGGIIVGGRQVEPAALRTIVEEAVAANPELKVTLRGDRATAYENVVRVLDICKSSGVQQPYLDTVLE